MRSFWAIPLIGVTASLATACNSQVHLGKIGDGGSNVLWTATFEPGDLSEWSADGKGGVYVENAVSSPTVVPGPAHGGRYAGRVTTAPSGGMVSTNYFFRDQPSPPEAYYSCWFYVAPDFTVGFWLSLIHFRTSDTDDGRNPYPTWDMNMNVRPTDGALIPKLYNFVTQVNYYQTPPSVAFPVGRWVHMEVFMRKSNNLTGRIALWMDDALLLDLNNISTGKTNWVEWSVGVSSADISPTPGTVYIDDAAISLTPVGTAGF
jgi:hypothetical protein